MNRFGCKLAQAVLGQGHETMYFGDQRVKGQGHRRPKLDLEAWRRHHSRLGWVEWVFWLKNVTKLREFYRKSYECNFVSRLRMLQAQRQRKTAQKSATHTPSASLPASSAPSEDGASTQNGTTVETSSTQVVPDTDVDSDSDMPTRQPSVATASHDSDTEVSSYKPSVATASHDSDMEVSSYKPSVATASHDSDTEVIS